MPPKRRHRHTDSDASEEQTTKKAKVSDSSDPIEAGRAVDLNTQAVYKEILEHLYNQEDSDGRLLWEMFDELPTKDELPVYYEFIENPVDLKTIKKKIQTHQYEDIDELEVDILLVFSNARLFNEPRSQISKDATCLKRAYLAKRVELNKNAAAGKPSKREKSKKTRTVSIDSEQSEISQHVEELETEHEKDEDEEDDEEDRECTPMKSHQESSYTASSASRGVSSSNSTPKKDDGLIGDSFEPNVFSILYNIVVGFTDMSGRKLSQPFLRLPVRRAHLDYYEVVKRPLSLGKVRTKIKASYYNDLNILEKDLNRVFDNAQEYHHHSSAPHTDAMILQSLMQQKKKELEVTPEYLEMREGMPKRGRPKTPKHENIDEIGGSPTPNIVKKRKPREPIVSADDPEYLKKRMQQLYSCVLEYKDSEGRVLSEMFLELPDKIEYPDYYKVIPNPIDMGIIKVKLDRGQYTTEEDFIHDFEVMFQNARHFNEEGSEIYEDSVTLEKALRKKKRWLAHIADGKTASPMKAPRQNKVLVSHYSTSCQELLTHIRSYTDESGRSLTSIFERLPSRMEYPEYYALIKKPIDLAYICSRVNKYGCLDDLEQDLLQMFDNACHFNEPDSQIYKDALTLLRVMILKKNELEPDVNNMIPNVQELVQNLLKVMYTNVMNHRDEEGRCYSDSLLEVMCSTVEEEEENRKPISLPIISQLLKLGFYKRLDQLQEDFFTILKKCRKEGRTDSEIYEDACELETYFILERDRLTKDGLRLMSPSFNFTLKSVQHDIDDERKEKQRNEIKEEEEEKDDSQKTKLRSRGVMTVEVQPDEEGMVYLTELTVKGIKYRLGDYVFVKPEEQNRPPHIVSIEKIWAQKDGLQGIYGTWYYRPEATFHLASRKFIEKEVFRSHHSSFIISIGLIGLCYVMNVKEYSKLLPEGFEEDDVFVCESRYNGKTKSFKKIKTFPAAANHIKLIDRAEPLVVKRISSVFAGSGENKKDNGDFCGDREGIELNSIDGFEFPQEKHCEAQSIDPGDGRTYYETYVANKFVFKLGDSVYVKTDEDYCMMAKIDKIWADKDNEIFFHGPWYVQPEDTKHMPTQLFYKQEIFESNVEETFALTNVVGKCAILNLRDYQYSRPTEVDEKDIYLCCASYNEEEMKFRRNVKGFKRLTQPSHIRDDEFWYFDQPYNPKRRPSQWLMADQTGQEETNIELKSEDGEALGYALMKKELAASLMKENPELSLNEIQSKTDEKWASLTREEKELYKSRAKAQGLLNSLYVYQCAWSNCEYQFEDLQDLMVHVMEGPHVIRSPTTGLFPCLWRDCKREGAKRPFQTHSRLVRHIREIHFKLKRKKILASEKSKLYFPRHQTCENGYRSPSERGSSRASSAMSPLSPNAHIRQAMLQQKAIGMFQSMNSNPMNNSQNSPTQMQANMFPPYRLNGQPTPQAVIMQQQILQQQMLMQQRLASPRGSTPPMQVPQQQAQQQVQQPGHLPIEQQQMLLTQVQRQQQEIMKLQQQVQMLNQQHQQQQQQQQQQQKPTAEQAPVFVTPPANTQKLRHSEAYLRYIEGLRDNRSQLSNWKELANRPHPKTSQNLPVHWLGENVTSAATDALWALRDHMLRDAVTLSKYI